MNLTPLKSQPHYIKLASLLFILISLGFIVILAKKILLPLLFSCLFSILLLPMATFLEKRLRLSRGIAALISVLLMLSCIVTVLYLIVAQISHLAVDWSKLEFQINTAFLKLQDWINLTFHINSSSQLNYLHAEAAKLLSSGTSIVGLTLLSISSMLFFFVFTFAYSLLFLIYRKLIMSFLVAVCLNKNSTMVYDIMEQVQFIIRKYIIGLMIEMAIVSFVVCSVFWALGIEYPILLGLIAGLFNIIPYIGIISALVLSSLITFITTSALSKVFIVVLTLVITHLLDSNILFPALVGARLRINALITILGVIIGENIWGISGMFLSIPVIAVMKIVFDRVDSLKPWGIILGDQSYKPNKLVAKITAQTKENDRKEQREENT